jgi:hypothetical protein
MVVLSENFDTNKLKALIETIEIKAKQSTEDDDTHGEYHNGVKNGEIYFSREIMWQLQESGIIKDNGSTPF